MSPPLHFYELTCDDMYLTCVPFFSPICHVRISELAQPAYKSADMQSTFSHSLVRMGRGYDWIAFFSLQKL